MRAFFATQSGGLRTLYELMLWLREPLELESSGFLVSEAMFFQRFAREHPEVERDSILIKEWELMSRALKAEGNARGADALRRLETESGRPSVVWEALFCDRRLMLGPLARWKPDYRPRFTHDQLLAIAGETVATLEATFDTLRPDVLLSFTPVSFGEYLAWAVARARGIPTLYFGPTKIKNRMLWADNFFGQPARLLSRYEALRGRRVESPALDEARAYLATVKRGSAEYEGMIPVPVKGARTAVPQRRRPAIVPRLARLVRSELEYLATARNDNHVRGLLAPLWHARVVIPARARLHSLRLQRHYVRDLAERDYAFFPLNSEPEISLSIHSKAFVNQIEAVRAIARSLPIGMELLVKEHPRSIGYRSVGYYEKLLRIPNVRLVAPDVESAAVVQHARIVITLWSFVGFEAAIKGRPAIVLGTPSFTCLPETMIRSVSDINTLGRHVGELLASYQYDEHALESFVAANIDCSIPFDFYTIFLNKTGRITVSPSGGGNIGDVRAEQMRALAAYTVQCVAEAIPSQARRATA
jgi:hypothetical protein